MKLEKIPQLTGADRTKFIANWLKANKTLMDAQMGINPADEVLGEYNWYLTGILFTTAASIQTVPQLQEGIQGDACHLQFGKYKLFSAYGSKCWKHQRNRQFFPGPRFLAKSEVRPRLYV